MQGINSRVKARPKIQGEYERPDKEYCKLTDWTDLAGLRIITYLSAEVDKVDKVVSDQFPVQPTTR